MTTSGGTAGLSRLRRPTASTCCTAGVTAISAWSIPSSDPPSDPSQLDHSRRRLVSLPGTEQLPAFVASAVCARSLPDAVWYQRLVSGNHERLRARSTQPCRRTRSRSRSREDWERDTLRGDLNERRERNRSNSPPSPACRSNVCTPAEDLGAGRTLERRTTRLIPVSTPTHAASIPTMYRGRLWTMRQFAGFGSAGTRPTSRFKYLLRARAERSFGRLRSAHADGARQRRRHGSRGGRQGRRGDRLAGRHGDPVRRHPAGDRSRPR